LVVELVVNVTVLVELVALAVALVVEVVQALLEARLVLAGKALQVDLILRDHHTLELVAVELEEKVANQALDVQEVSEVLVALAR
jgi:hypothetical protein